MELLKLIELRRSVRAYQSKPVENEKLALVLEAGRLAPSARNGQDWKFVVVQDKALIEKLVPACCDQKFVGEAPAFLAICSDDHGLMRCGQPVDTVDCSIALSFMMLQAAELGLGTCWLGSFYEDAVREILHIPEQYRVVAVTPLGYPVSEPKQRPRKPIEVLVAQDDQWAF